MNIFPLIALTLGADTGQVAIIYSISYLVSTFSTIPGGIAADRFLRKRIMIAGWLVATPSALIFALSSDWVGLLIGELLYCTSNFSGPASSAFIASKCSKGNAGIVFSLSTISNSMAMLISPAIGGFVAVLFGIRYVFVASFAAYAASTMFIMLVSERAHSAAYECGQSPTFTTVRDYLPLFRDRGFMRVCALFGLVFLSIYISMPFVPIFISSAYGLTFSSIGILGSASALGGMIISLLFGGLADRFDKLHALAGLLVMFCASAAILVLSGEIAMLFISFFLAGSTLSFYSVMSAFVGTNIEERNAGKAFAVLETVTGIPVIIAPFIGSALYAYSPMMPIVATIVLCPIMIIVLAIVPMIERRNAVFKSAYIFGNSRLEKGDIYLIGKRSKPSFSA